MIVGHFFLDFLVKIEGNVEIFQLGGEFPFGFRILEDMRESVCCVVLCCIISLSFVFSKSKGIKRGIKEIKEIRILREKENKCSNKSVFNTHY